MDASGWASQGQWHVPVMPIKQRESYWYIINPTVHYFQCARRRGNNKVKKNHNAGMKIEGEKISINDHRKNCSRK